MTNDEILEMARATGVLAGYEGEPSYLMIFAKALYDAGADAQREASAKLCNSLAVDRGFFHPDDEEFKRGVLAGASMCAATIRLRKD